MTVTGCIDKGTAHVEVERGVHTPACRDNCGVIPGDKDGRARCMKEKHKLRKRVLLTQIHVALQDFHQPVLRFEVILFHVVDLVNGDERKTAPRT